MKTVASLLIVLLLAACSAPQGEATKSEATAAPQQQAATTESASPAAPMSDMPSEATVASASGKVEAVDTTAGTVTIAHGPVEALKWPAMTMAFKASPEQLASVKAGQQVEFEFEAKGMDSTITRITPTK